MAAPERIISVDFLRGVTVAAMIMVNNPGSWDYVYAPLAHASWNGCTPTDLVFPFFLFIVGISIAYSLGKAKEGPSQKGVVGKILKRSCILFLLGLFLNAFPLFDLANLRIPGVLQRIAIVFAFSALMYLKTSHRTQVWTALSILVGYWILLSFVPVPGIGEANLNPATNMGAWLDNTLLNGHLWKFSNVWDPEGILSTMPALASGLIGVLTGTWLKSQNDASDKVIRLFVTANVLVVCGLAWDLFFPINKSLWTSSYVLYTSGLALHALALSYWLIDIRQYRSNLKPFLAFGSNAIAAYMLSELLAGVMYTVTIQGDKGETNLRSYIFQSLNTGWINPYLLSFVLAMIWVLLIWIPVSIMYRKKIFIKV